MARVKVTVVKRLNFNEIHRDSNPGCSANIAPVCDQFTEGQEFIMDWEKVPEGFCPPCICGHLSIYQRFTSRG